MKNSYEEQFITEFCNKIKTEGCSKNTIAEQVFDAGYRLAVPARVNSNDGWIAWAGGECPVECGVLVEVEYRNEKAIHKKGANRAGVYCWTHDNNDGDIIAYRLHHPQDANSRANDDRLLDNLRKNDSVIQAVHAGFEELNTSIDSLLSREVETREKITAAESELNECIGQIRPDSVMRWNLLAYINEAGIQISLSDAIELANTLIDAGYRKQ